MEVSNVVSMTTFSNSITEETATLMVFWFQMNKSNNKVQHLPVRCPYEYEKEIRNNC